MLQPTSIRDQYAQVDGDRLRVLVVGAGIAGVTVAQLLRGRGFHPVLVDRLRAASHTGYMLGLMPMVDPVLDELGVHERYRRASVPADRYGLHAHRGRLLREDSVGQLLTRYGEYRGIARGELLDVLTADGCPVALDTTVTALAETATGVDVTLATGDTPTRLEFDLVVVADGLHSATRDLVLDGRQVDVLDTGWGGWVAWAPEDADTDLGEELWGAGFFLGTYPVLGGVGVFLGGDHDDTAVGTERFVERVRADLTTTSPRIESALDAVRTDPDPYYWPLTDCRAPVWHTGGTVLLGDAAAGFLPTAAIGAGMAMESAWVLAGTLAHARRETLGPLLDAYETAQRPRVEAAQDTSRQLARLMFHRSRALATLRDAAMRMMSVRSAIKPILRLLAESPDPDAVAAAATAPDTRRSSQLPR